MYTFDTDDDLKAYIQANVLTSGEVLEILRCSRENLNDLRRRGKLVPIKELAKVKLFLKSDVEHWIETRKILNTKLHVSFVSAED